ncbi:MAG: aminomethyl-transferring glycine dehydrogenase subunit GcvPB [Candidatus Thermoplasmatota archaeon]|nr:aminomethyl-transferring glycine dehydrogenase subunit GcvPB [Candidatus Thermoplasmatota archaeon]
MDPERFRQARWEEPTLFDLDEGPGQSQLFPDPGEVDLPEDLVRETAGVPTVNRARVTRHFTRLAQMTFGIDTGSYPLGSCTMKYNAKVPELLAHDPGILWAHPLAPDEDSQGILALLWELQEALKEISGLDAVTLQPAAGAQGEFVAMLMVRAYYEAQDAFGPEGRCEVIVPDSAHGTNPASAAMAGFKVVEIPSGEDGCVDLQALEEALSERTAAFMLTNPNTLGIFEQNVEKVAEMVHQHGAKLYYDGANLNAILGVTNPGAMGFDVMHFNVHKTFATPHGGGGPGAGPVACSEELAPYLPVPRIAKQDGETGPRFSLAWEASESIGSVKAFHGNVGVLLRALAYIRLHGGDGLTRNTETAVANANYVYQRVHDLYEAPGHDIKKHEFVASAKRLKDEKGVTAMDVAKRLLDHGIHSPTVYFPLNVEEAIMIEPTETESREELDQLIQALRSIAEEDPETVTSAPHNTAVDRVDEVYAARNPILTWDQAQAEE